MKFTVKEKTTSDLRVEFEDGTWAVLPLNKGMTLDQIKVHVGSYNNTQVPFDKVDDIPLKVGTEYDTEIGDKDPDLTYKEVRRMHYPEIGRQLDALYWARQGDDTKSKAVDTLIKLIKDTIPKNKTYKTSEAQKIMD
tara:strand:+ start:187 stop:597 length:411 start_codon:yes stop_codon:yes gene_type:complete